MRWKKRFKIALTDCSVIAYAKMVNAIALFRRVEKEMKSILEKLEKEAEIALLEELGEA